MSNQTFDLSKFKILNSIGHGNFADVYCVENPDTKEIYAAKVLKNELQEDIKNSEETMLLFREINIMAALNHPSVIHYFGFFHNDFNNLPHPTILIEYAPNETLKKVISESSSGLSNKTWDETKKLICIYGIASGMSFLHKHKILHRDLKPENILMDENFLPKISDFGLSKITGSISESLCAKSTVGFKGTPLYTAPEVFSRLSYSEKSDVYSFAIIVYQIVTGVENPFPHALPFTFGQKIIDGERPELTQEIPKSYRTLIENCWDPDPNNRPTFDQILEVLKNDGDFITDLVDQDEFYLYQDYLDESQISFDIEKNRIRLDDFLRKKQRKVQEAEANAEKASEVEPNKMSKNDDKPKFDNEHSIYPLHEFDSLNKSCQTLVRESSSNPSKQFIVGKNLVEGLNDFPHNVQLGIKFLQLAKIQKYNEAIIYLSTLYVKGDVVPQDLEEALQILNELEDKNDVSRIFLLGLIKMNDGNNQEAFHLFQRASKCGNAEAMFYCGKMLMDGDGIDKNEKEGHKYLELAKKNGFQETYKPKEKNKSKSKKIKQNKKEKDEKKLSVIPKNVKIKVVFVGDGAVGKTCSYYHLTGKDFDNFDYTGIFDNCVIFEEYKGSKIQISLWDLNGQHDFKDIRVLSYPKADIILLFFSIVEPVSLYNISDFFIPEVKEIIANPTFILVACKIDLQNDEATISCLSQQNQEPVSKEIIQEFALKYGIERVVFVSNKIYNPIGIAELKNAIIETYLEKITGNKSCSIF